MGSTRKMLPVALLGFMEEGLGALPGGAGDVSLCAG